MCSEGGSGRGAARLFVGYTVGSFVLVGRGGGALTGAGDRTSPNGHPPVVAPADGRPEAVAGVGSGGGMERRQPWG